jgi:hypothetical protein
MTEKLASETPEEPKSMFRYYILRYVPNLIRDEWVNIGILLEEANGSRIAMRLIDGKDELARLRRIHPDADEDLLRNLQSEFDARLRAPSTDVHTYVEKLNQSLSNTLQFSPRKALLGASFHQELDRLYRDQVTPPSRRKKGVVVQSARDSMRDKLNDVFLRHRVLAKLEQRVAIEGFTHRGDPMRIDYGYQNGERGFIQTISLRRDLQQAKVLAYTAERIHARDSRARVTAITEVEPSKENPSHQFVEELFAEQKIKIVSINHVEGFAEELRLSLN